ncbi:hypothetical protein [Moorena producens]|nr:hypothetical protein [Moorena producens]
MRYTYFFPSCRLDAIASGGNPQDRAASLLPLAFCLLSVPCSLFPVP